MLLKVVATGRAWGETKEEVSSKLKIAGVSILVREFDAWDGPTEADAKGQYFRFTMIEAEHVRDDRYSSRLTGEA